MERRGNGHIHLCHITKNRLIAFFQAIEASAYTKNAILPQDFFTEKELARISCCDRCTNAVLLVYDFSVQVWSIEEMLLLLYQSMMIVKKGYRDRYERIAHLQTC